MGQLCFLNCIEEAQVINTELRDEASGLQNQPIIAKQLLLRGVTS